MPEEVQYFLRTYVTEDAIGEASGCLESLRQLPIETENALAFRIGNTAYRCGNVQTDTEKIFIFGRGLLPIVQPIVARYRPKNPHCE